MAPLSGIKVLDFSTLLPGPLATRMLGEAGAAVTKVERPEGDDMAGMPPAGFYAALNAGKHILRLDLKRGEDRDAAMALVAQADVLVEQFRPGVMERLGLGYAACRAANPGLIYCSITGYGQTGPRAQRAGHDLNYLAETGLLSVPATGPAVPPALMADVGGGTLPAVTNILLALLARATTGRGVHLDIAMADNVAALAPHVVAGLVGDNAPARSALDGHSPRYRLYATADGRYVAVGALEEKFWRAFCDAIALPDELRDERGRETEVAAAVAARIAARALAHWEPILAARDCCASAVRTLVEAQALGQIGEADEAGRTLALLIDRGLRRDPT